VTEEEIFRYHGGVLPYAKAPINLPVDGGYYIQMFIEIKPA